MTLNRTHTSLSKLHNVTALGLLVTIGIVFGDIGTSPLYVMKAIVGVNPYYDADYIIGAVSCVIWTLTLQTTLKYVLIALHADNKGEGGILSLYALLKKLPYKKLYIVAAVGASTLIADGVITPAITVTSAVEGLQAFDSSIHVTPIVVAIIALIFIMQQAGTGKIGRLFGPFMLIWFLMLGVSGCSVIGLDSNILKAFNPWYAVRLLADNPLWMPVLGAVFLCTTGAEALYSDLGHCGRKNISISWIFVKIMLILNYLGQGAWLLTHPMAATDCNPFYAILPEWLSWGGVVMSTGAAIIASQALLSGSFTIFSEAIGLKFWPRQRIKYPSEEKGQLYIPAVNWTLFVGCMIAVLMFGNSGNMEAAYGLAITVTMLMTTVLLSVYLRHKGMSLWIVGLFSAFFVTVEGLFCWANMMKFAHGGWFTILIAGIIAAIMILWYMSERMRSYFITYKPIADYTAIISDIKADESIAKSASNLVYFSKSPHPDFLESKLLYSIVNKQPKRADHYWIIHTEFTDDPYTLEYEASILIPETLYDIHVRIGFREPPHISVYLRQIVEDLEADGSIDLRSGYPSLRARGIAGDFRFIVIRRVFSSASICNSNARMLMKFNDIVSHLGRRYEDLMGLDTSNVTVETVPLIINQRTGRRIQRK